jgi:hypothetical protein
VRFLWQNYVHLGSAVLSCSSAENARPVRWLRDQVRTKSWRTQLGWTVVAGWNDKVDFSRGGSTFAATIAAGTYGTGTELAAAIVTALEAADATPVWACSYSATTFAFTLSADLAHTLLFGSGANLATSAALDLGFAAADSTSDTTHTGAIAVYQSRHYVAVDLGQALETKAAMVVGHNGGSFQLRGAAAAADALTNPATTQTLAGTSTLQAVFYTGATYRYWALIVDNRTSVDGFTEVGVWYLGGYLEPAKQYSQAFRRSRQDYSSVGLSSYGSNYQDRQGQAQVLEIQFANLAKADADAIDAMAAYLGAGRNLFVTLDPTAPADSLYVYLPRLPSIAYAARSVDLWNAVLSLVESV